MRPYRSLRSRLMTLLVAVSVSLCGQANAAEAAPPGAPPPIIDSVDFRGNTKVPTATLASLVQLRPGENLSGERLTPELERIVAAYRSQGGAGVWPRLLERGLGHVAVTFEIQETGAPQSAVGADGMPVAVRNALGNTQVCASAGTSNDLCHAWVKADGTLIQIDSNGPHAAHWIAGPVQADGRLAICQYWDTGRIVMPPELMQPTSPLGKGGSVCVTKDFRTACKNYDDLSGLEPELQRKGKRTMAQRFQEEGVCYQASYYQYPVGSAWFGAGNPLPGQLGLDRMILLPGHQ